LSVIVAALAGARLEARKINANVKMRRFIEKA
jgi:hypothetical protein